MNSYRLFKRSSGIYFIQDNRTGKQESLRTRDEEVAKRLVFHRNEAGRVAGANRQIAIGYLIISDPEIKTRCWHHVMEAFCALPGKEATRRRKQIALKDPAFAKIKNLSLIETRPEHFMAVLRSGTVSTNSFLRKFHNYARRMKWLPEEVLTRGGWPAIRYAPKRAITQEEHEKILAVTPTEERRVYYQVLWETGASQSDVARMTADFIDLEKGLMSFKRVKLDGKPAGQVCLSMGPTLEALLESRPREGFLFPTLAEVGENDRSTAFGKHCVKAGVEGVTLHSYRYAVIQRAKRCGYNKRYAMAMVGHSNHQTHDDYARGGEMMLPSLEECELAFAMAQIERQRTREKRKEKIIRWKGELNAEISEAA